MTHQRMYPRSEFPIHEFRPITNAKGAVSLVALAERFSAFGCPNASPSVAAAMIKAGCDYGVAVKCAMIAHYAQEVMMEPLARTCRAIEHAAERDNALRFPHGKCAKDIAARRAVRDDRQHDAQESLYSNAQDDPEPPAHFDY